MRENDRPNSEEHRPEISKPNHLISEKSPYLLQHAHNPVDWYPWGDEAFQKALQEDKPVFLSVGYSTCHWCHVMAHESFEDPDVAALMNRAFVCIKVDREERPDIDGIYMAAAMGMTGRGGWPLTIIMTADKKPFFAATYLPKHGRFGQAGLMELIPKIEELWRNNRPELQSSANKITDYLRQNQAAASPSEELNASALRGAYQGLASIFDSQNGGFGTSPKFPTPHNLLFLLRYWRRYNDAESLQMVEATLQAMRSGGIYDHVGFGFHRYSTDSGWLVPHFEKMLYDQALLSLAYTEAHLATGKEEYARTAGEILEYVLRDMTSEQGGFYTAEDADSEGEEGRFYLWTAAELKELLEKDEFNLAIRIFELYENGNFEGGRNIIRQRSSFPDAAAVLKRSEQELRDRWELIRLKLFAARDKRIRPLRDEKVLTDWNGLMMVALCRAAQALHEPRYAAAAQKAADNLLKEMRTPEGRLLHRYKDGPGIQGNLDDYAFLIWGLIDLYETVFDARYLQAALELNGSMLEHFWDDVSGGLFFSPDDGDDVLVRRKEIYDGAIPSGNSVAMLNLLRLSHLSGRADAEEKAHALSQAFASTAIGQPLGHTMLMCALDFALGPSFEVAVVGARDDAATSRLLHALRSRFLPNKVVILVSGAEIRQMVEYTRGLSQQDGKATAYVCSGHSCQMPTTDPDRLLQLLDDPGRS